MGVYRYQATLPIRVCLQQSECLCSLLRLPETPHLRGLLLGLRMQHWIGMQEPWFWSLTQKQF